MIESATDNKFKLTKVSFKHNGFENYEIFYQAPDDGAVVRAVTLQNNPTFGPPDSGDINNYPSRALLAQEAQLGLKRQDSIDAKTGKIIPAFTYKASGGTRCIHYNGGTPHLLFGLAHGYDKEYGEEPRGFRLDDEGKIESLPENEQPLFQTYYNFYMNLDEALSLKDVPVFSISAMELAAEQKATDKLQL